VCLHIALLGVASLILSQDLRNESPIEKKFRVGLRKNTAAKAVSSYRQADKSFKPSEQKLPQTREFPQQHSRLQKTQKVKMLAMRPSFPDPIRVLKKRPLDVHYVQNVTPRDQEFVAVAHEFPTPIPTPKPTPAPTPLPNSIPEKPTPIPTKIPEPKEQIQPVKMPVVSSPTATASPVSPLPAIAQSTSVHNQNQEKTGVTTVKEPESKEAKRSTTQQEKTLLKQYLQEVAAKINAVKKYPRNARRKGWEGTVVIKLSILPTGKVEKVVIANKSQYNALNKAALQAIEKAQPFPEFYQGLTSQSIIVNVPIQFTLGK